MCVFTPAEIVTEEDRTFGRDEERLAIEALAAYVRHPDVDLEDERQLWERWELTGIRPSFIGRNWDRIIKRAKAMRDIAIVAAGFEYR